MVEYSDNLKEQNLNYIGFFEVVINVQKKRVVRASRNSTYSQIDKSRISLNKK